MTVPVVKNISDRLSGLSVREDGDWHPTGFQMVSHAKTQDLSLLEEVELEPLKQELKDKDLCIGVVPVAGPGENQFSLHIAERQQSGEINIRHTEVNPKRPWNPSAVWLFRPR